MSTENNVTPIEEVQETKENHQTSEKNNETASDKSVNKANNTDKSKSKKYISLKNLLENEDFMRNNYPEHIPTGFDGLDSLLGGGLPTGLTVLGAISSLGKSTLSLQIAQNIASNIENQGRKVIYFSLEMTGHAIILKALQRKAFENLINNPKSDYVLPDDYELYLKNSKDTISMEDLHSFFIKKSEEKRNKLQKVIEIVKKETENLFVVERSLDNDTFSGEKIKEYIHKFIKDNEDIKKPVVFIDYLQILSSESKKPISEKQVIDENIQALWRLANDKDNPLPVVVLSALNREAYNKSISFASFKESGGIEYTADVVLGMQFSALHGQINNKDFNADFEKTKDPRDVEIVVLKQRYGKTGTDVFTRFDFYPKFNCFIEKEVNIDKSNDKEKKPKQTKSSKKQLSMPHRTNPKN